MALVIKQWHYSTAPDAFGRHVEILGRQSGVFSWLLALLGVVPTVRIVVTGKEYIMEKTSLLGRKYIYIPLAKISSTYHGYTLPLEPLVFFVAVAPWMFKYGRDWKISPIFSIGIVFVAGVVAIIWVWLKKKMTLGVFEMGGRAHGIEFNRSLIEGVSMDKDAAEATGIIISGLIRSKN